MKFYKKLLIFIFGLLFGLGSFYGLMYWKSDTFRNYHLRDFLKKDSSAKTSSSLSKNTSNITTSDNTNTNPSINPITITGNINVPILLYHHIKINDQPNNQVEASLDVTPDNFTKQMVYMKTLGYETINMRQLWEAETLNYALPKKSFIITFDDGYTDNYTTALPILKQYSYKATFYLITYDINKPRYMTTQQIKSLISNGMEIGSHTITHPNLANTSNTNAKKQIESSKDFLESHFGIKVETFCYPSGKYNDNVKEMVSEAGYLTAVGTQEGAVTKDADLLVLKRIKISGSTTLAVFGDKLGEKSKTTKKTTSD